MRTGTRLVVLFVVLGGVALALFRLYGDRVMAERAAPSPLAAARAALQADNTAVGTVGAIRSVTATRMRPLGPDGAAVALAADVVGALGGGTLYADLEPDGRRWRVVRARLVVRDGPVVPIAGAEAPALQP